MSSHLSLRQASYISNTQFLVTRYPNISNSCNICDFLTAGEDKVDQVNSDRFTCESRHHIGRSGRLSDYHSRTDRPKTGKQETQPECLPTRLFQILVKLIFSFAYGFMCVTCYKNQWKGTHPNTAITIGLIWISSYSVIFIGPRSDHSLPMSLTNWLTDWLTDDLVEDLMNWPLLMESNI